MKLLFSENNHETSSGYELDQTGGNPFFKDMVVPAGLFFLQKTFKERSEHYNSGNSDEVISESLYDKLFSLVDDTTKSKTKKRAKGRKNSKNKTKKNN